MALGVYITFRLLNVSDLTVDGSFATGRAVTVMLLLQGLPAWAALLIAVLVGLLTGLCTGLLHTKFGIPAILAGILTQFALYSINLRIMGKANQTASIKNFGMFWETNGKGLSDVVALCAAGAHCRPVAFGRAGCAAILVLRHRTGSAMRATGANPSMSRAQGINVSNMKLLGLALSNGMVALAGGLMTQFQGTADVSMGRGAIVIGLAAIIIGEVLCDAIFRKGCNFAVRLLFVVFGGVGILCGHGAHPLAQARPERPQALHGSDRRDLPRGPSYVSREEARLQSTRKEAAAMLELQSISKTFHPGTIHAKKALQNLSLSLNDGDFVTVIGGNGAGKSTLFNAIAGVWPVDEGSILIDGVDVTGLPEYKRAAFIGRVFQDPMLGTAPNMQIEENLALALRRGKSARFVGV